MKKGKKKMDINKLTVGELKEVASLARGLGVCDGSSKSDSSHPYKVGEKYFIRTPVMYYVGVLEQVFQNELVLSSAAWVADTGRFSEFLSSGKPVEVEPFPDGNVIVPREGCEATLWPHGLLRKTK